ncbi:MAG: hypothetical protein HYZ15_13320 [Sphingobacteriales bacterium]|nr:hypothetical protein [Sphingobacteriales bacterium]
MKRFYFFLVLLFAVQIANSQLLTENFSYTVGQALTANGWTAHSGAGTNAITVTAPGLTYSGHPGSGVGNAVTMTVNGEDVNKAFTSTNTGAVYVSFLVNLSAAQTGDYFAGLFQTTSIFPLRVYAKSDGAGGYFFGASKSNSAVVYETNARVFGTTYLFVAKYTFNTGTTTDDQIDIWINPALGGTESTPTIPGITGTSTDATSISAFYLRQGSATAAATPRVDAILVGTTWASVTPSSVVPPSLSISSPLAAFGNVCINTTAGPNSFTIAGSNLSTADVTVGALTGFTYSTTLGGSYTPTLTLTQPGGTFSQDVFVKFDPLAVQSYDGDIAVAGGGAATGVNAAATGAGVYTAPAVTSGAASAITQTTATVAGTITAEGCAAVTAYGIEYSTTAGFPNGTGTAVASANNSGGNFSSDLTGLTLATVYYYHAYATSAAGTSYGAEQSFTTASPDPTITVTPLAAFGAICINTTAGPGSFTISGANLTTADVTVGALSGFTYSTTAGGTYTTTLTLAQTGGTFSQEVFVKFAPTAVQVYDGTIQVNGGGVAAPVDVAASGEGVDSPASVTTGAASAITYNSATAAGSIPSTGCSAVTAYGIEYSTSNGFPDGTGTQVAASNLGGGNFSAGLSGLAASTVYYYKAWATNSGGTAYGAQQSFSTPAVPILLTATALPAFGPACINSTAGPVSFTINGELLTNADINVGPLAGYSFSVTSGGAYTSSLSLTQAGGTYSQQVFVKFSPAAVQSYNGNIPVAGGGFAGTVNVAASGSGVNTPASVATGTAANLTTESALVAGQVIADGCSPVTGYGIEFSGVNGFANGTGTPVAGTGISAGSYTIPLNGLVQGATYYYKAYAVNSGGVSYGTQQTFTMPSVGEGFRLYPNPVARGAAMRITVKEVKPGYYGLLLFNSQGERVYQWNMNIQSGFINQTFSIPATLPKGVYRAYLVNQEKEMGVITILVL